MNPSVAKKRSVFRRLHEQGRLILPNPWDLGSLRRMERMGAKAVASTSAGFAESRGREDYQMTRAEVLAHLQDLCAATDLPLNADFESGFAETAQEIGKSVEMAIETGVAGLSIEDRCGSGLYDEDTAVERLDRARGAIDNSGQDVMLVARCEGFLTGTATTAEVIARLKAYSQAGADVLYAPGARDGATIRAIVAAAAPKPVNVLLFPGMRAGDLFALGVCRVSTGDFLADAAWQGLDRAARSVLDQGQLPAMPES